jgi:hypothetical protein
MEFTDYMLWKLGVLFVASICYGFWKAFTGR